MLPNDCIEQWRAVEGWPHYEVSDLGRVRSRGRMQGMKLRTATNGYQMVMLTDKPRRQNICVHQLVLRAFAGREPDGYECRHLDGNKSNNRLSNLKWGTPAENGQDRIEHGTQSRGEHRYNAKLTDELVRWIREQAASGRDYASIASECGMKENRVAKATTGRVFKHIGKQVAKRNPVKLTVEMVAEIRRLSSEGRTNVAIAAGFGIKACTVSLIVHGRRWKL